MMIDFRLQFRCAEIRALSDRYSYRSDEAARRAGKAAGRRGYYLRPEYELVVRWKSARSTRYLDDLDDATVEGATRNCLSEADEAKKISALTGLPGIGIPIGSTLLAFAHPDRYPILDWRALQALGYRRRHTQYTVQFWLAYLAACRDLADECKTDLRTLDKAMWQWSKEQEQLS